MIGDIVKLLENLPAPLLAIIHRVVKGIVSQSNPYDAGVAAERAALAGAADAAADVAAEKIIEG